MSETESSHLSLANFYKLLMFFSNDLGRFLWNFVNFKNFFGTMVSKKLRYFEETRNAPE